MDDDPERVCRVDVWVRQVEADVDPSCLDDVERARLEAFRDARQARSYAAGHVLARTVLATVLGVEPPALRFDRTCAVCGAQHGRPVLEGTRLHVGLARTDGVVAFAVSADAAVGVDVESVSGTDFPGFPDTALHPDERAAVEVADGSARLRRRAVAWTRKEAVLKAAGVGLRVDPATFHTPPSGIPTQVPGVDGDVTVVDLDLGSRLDLAEVVGAVALLRPAGAVSARLR